VARLAGSQLTREIGRAHDLLSIGGRKRRERKEREREREEKTRKEEEMAHQCFTDCSYSSFELEA
jgi:hypothetical protein